jgi:hypothetical protein
MTRTDSPLAVSEGSRRTPKFGLFGAPPAVGRADIGIGFDNEQPRVAVEHRIRAIPEQVDVDTHDHRHAPRPRENRNMARGTSAPQHQPAVAPVGRQEHRRRHVVGRDDDAGRHDLLGFARQVPQHAIA